MSVTPEQIAAANKANVENLLALANAAFANAEKLAALNLATARTFLEDSVANTKALLGAKDLQEVVSLQTAQAQPGVEKVVAYSKSVYEISSKAQEEVSKLVEGQFSEVNKAAAELMDKLVAQAPAGSETAVAALKSAMAAANSAYDSINKAAKQVAEIAQSNVATATDAAVKAVSSAAAPAAAPKAGKKAA